VARLEPIKLMLRVTTGPNGLAHQPVLKGTSWVEDFYPSARFGPSCPARQLNGPKYRSVHTDLLTRFKNIK